MVCALVCMPALGYAQSVTLDAPLNVASAEDFATRAFQDPWDMNELTDFGWFLYGADQPSPDLSNLSFSNGIFSATTGPSPNLFLLETGNPYAARLGKTGTNHPIDANTYRMVAMRVNIDASTSGAFYWNRDHLWDGTISISGTFGLTPGWRTYLVDLPTLGLRGGTIQWNGIIRSLQFSPSAVDQHQLQIDWIRLVNLDSSLCRRVTWSGFAGAVDLYLEQNGNETMLAPGATNNTASLGCSPGGSGYSFYAGALAPGTYQVLARAAGSSAAVVRSATAYQVNAAPTLSITAPSEEGSADDFATTQLGNPWDMNAVSDVEQFFNSVTNPTITTLPTETPAGASLGPTNVLHGVSVPAQPPLVGDPIVGLVWPPGTLIDPTRYRILTVEMGLPNLARSINTGSVARIAWRVAGGTDSVSDDIIINSRAGANVMDKVIVDMADRTVLPIEQGTSQAGWVPGTSATPGIDRFRVDPHEFSSPTPFFVKRVKLAALEHTATGSTYTIRWTASEGGTVTLYRDTDRDPLNGGLTQIGTTSALAGAGQFVWNANTPGQHYIYVVINDNQGNSNAAYSRWPVVVGTGQTQPVVANFDGDRKADLAIFRPSSGTWFIANSATGYTTNTTRHWGLATDVPVSADYDADGRVDAAVYRPSTGSWYVLQSRTNSAATYALGTANDFAVPGDYDGDFRTDPAVYRRSTSVWYILSSSGNYATVESHQWGLRGDIPVPSDYDGDGKADLAVYRQSTNTWYILTSSSGLTTSREFQWGVSGDVPVPGDYDGDAITDIAVYRPGTGVWFIRKSTTDFATSVSFQWGLASDVPVPSDFDGDGKTDLAVYRPSTGTWFIAHSTSAYATSASYQWGQNGDTPAPQSSLAYALATRSTLATQVRASDFDADRRSDLTVYRPSNGTWFNLRSTEAFSVFTTAHWGLPSDIPVAQDYDGDGQTDFAVYRPSTGVWWSLSSLSGYTTWTARQLGLAGDLPAPGDYDGDAIADPAVYRPSTGRWYLLLSTTNFTTAAEHQLGLSGDLPVPGDYDGDAVTDIAVYRPSTGAWVIRYSSTGYATSATFQWGQPGDVPVPGEYDGDGKTDLAVYRPATGVWYRLLSSTNFTGFAQHQWGLSDDTPVPGDFDGDRKTDLAVWRPSTGFWYLLKSSTSFTTFEAVHWGLTGDIPILKP